MGTGADPGEAEYCAGMLRKLTGTALVIWSLLGIGVALATQAHARHVVPIRHKLFNAITPSAKGGGPASFSLEVLSANRVALSNTDVAVFCGDSDLNSATLQTSRVTGPLSRSGAFRLHIGKPAVTIAGHFSSARTAVGTVSFAGHVNGSSCRLHEPFSAQVRSRTLAQHYAGTTSTGATLSFEVDTPVSAPQRQSIQNFSVGATTVTCASSPGSPGAPPFPVAFSGGGDVGVHGGHFSTTGTAVFSSDDADLAAFFSGTIARDSASGSVGLVDRAGCGYSGITWTATLTPPTP